jgi:hypothetical protein
MSVLVDIKCCTINKDDESFWYTHQTMVDGHIWCVTKSIVDKAKSDVKLRYGNRKRHRQ